MSTEPGHVTAARYRTAYNAGHAAYGPSNGPKWAKAGAYADSLTGAAHGTPAAVQAYIDGWNAAKAAQPRRTYWQAELAKVNTTSPDGPEYDGARLTITGNGGGSTKSLRLTPSSYQELATYLLTIEETE